MYMYVIEGRRYSYMYTDNIHVYVVIMHYEYCSIMIHKSINLKPININSTLTFS